MMASSNPPADILAEYIRYGFAGMPDLGILHLCLSLAGAFFSVTLMQQVTRETDYADTPIGRYPVTLAGAVQFIQRVAFAGLSVFMLMNAAAYFLLPDRPRMPDFMITLFVVLLMGVASARRAAAADIAHGEAGAPVRKPPSTAAARRVNN